MPYSLSQALELLKTTELTPQALVNLAKQVSIEASGAVTVFYGGNLPDGKPAGDSITAMVTAKDKKHATVLRVLRAHLIHTQQKSIWRKHHDLYQRIHTR